MLSLNMLLDFMPVSKMKFLIHRISFSNPGGAGPANVDPKNLDKTKQNNTDKQIAINMDKKDQGVESDSGKLCLILFLHLMLSKSQHSQLSEG